MLNYAVLVGRLVSDPKKEKDKTIITLAISRSFKNENGEYEVDFIPCTLLGKTGKATYDYCKKGDAIGVKGRLVTDNAEIQIIAEKVTYLTSKKED